LIKKFRSFEKPKSRSIKNSLELVERLKDFEIGEDEIMVIK
jgi:hypothetical protein